jgi:hypothetical protein
MPRIGFNASTGALDLGRLQQWANIPAEMRQRKQWAVSTLFIGPDGKVDKKPRRADGREMEWKNPLQWLSFEEAVSSGHAGIGYILSAGDPFTIIDLDVKDATNEIDPVKWTTEEQKARHTAIFSAFPSYAELSQSGTGVHIILYGKINGGLNRDRVEVYDQERYIICTGNVLTPGPIQSHPELLSRLVEEMGGVSSTKELPPSALETCGDDELIQRIEVSRQGLKFSRLFHGPVEHGSENDAALFAILAFWTQNHDQIMRLFARSALYRPRGEADGKKGHTSKTYHERYLVDTMAGALALLPQQAEADLAHGKALAEHLLTTKKPSKPIVAQEFPHGLVGEIAHYIYHAAPYPAVPVAIAGALAFMAGLFGRQYTIIGGECLNVYITLLAPASSGKDAMRRGINTLFKEVEKQAPGVASFYGPEGVSATGWRKAFAEQNPCMISLVGEIGTKLQTMLGRRAGENDLLLKRFLLDVYTSGSREGRLQRTAHAKAENQVAAVEAPALSLLGESTPSEFYKAVTMDSFSDGLVPRFILISYRPPKEDNYNYNRVSMPAPMLVDKIVRLAVYAMQLQTLGDTGFIELRNSATSLADQMRAEYIRKVRAGDGETNTPEELMASRAWVNIMKVAGLLAVGRSSPGEVPTVVESDLRWAQKLVEGGLAEVWERQSSGDLISGEAKQVPAVSEAVMAFYGLTDKQKRDRKVPVFLLEHKDLIPHAYLRGRLRLKAEFANSPRGLEAAIKSAIQTALENGILQRLTDAQVVSRLGKQAPYAIYTAGSGMEN